MGWSQDYRRAEREQRLSLYVPMWRDHLDRGEGVKLALFASHAESVITNVRGYLAASRMKKASKHGSAFKNDIDLHGDALKADICDSHREFMYGVYSKISRRYYRPIGEARRETDDGT